MIVQNGLSLWKKIIFNEDVDPSSSNESTDEPIEDTNEDCDFYEESEIEDESESDENDENDDRDILIDNEDPFKNQEPDVN